MTAKKISELSSITALTGAEIIPTAIAGNNYKVTINEIKAFVSTQAASGTTGGLMSAADKQKLDSMIADATKNQADSFLLNRANHTGEISSSQIIGLAPVASSGDYNDLTNRPTILSIAEHQGRGGVDIHSVVTETQAGFMSPVHLGILQSIVNSAKGKIDDLLNVKIGNLDGTGDNPLNNGQVLSYSQAQAAWVNADSAGGAASFALGDGVVTDVSISMPENGQALTFLNGYWQNLPPSPQPSASATNAGLMSSAHFTKVQSLKTVATSGDYTDLANKPALKNNLSDMDDCTIGATTTGYVLTWSGTKWTPQAPTGGSGGGGGSIAVKSQNTQITTAATTINFIGAGVSATAASGVVTVTVPGAGSTNPTTVSSTPPVNPSVNDIWLKV